MSKNVSITKLTGIGWREWAYLPEFNKYKINAKVDTGALTSALHAEEIAYFKRRGKLWVRFRMYPKQRSRVKGSWVEAPLVEKRRVRSSVGNETIRPVVETMIKIGTLRFPIEVTLVDRGMMGYRMLLGRAAMKKRFWINPGVSYLATRKLNKRKHS